MKKQNITIQKAIIIKRMNIRSNEKGKILAHNSKILKMIDVTGWSMKRFNQYMRRLMK